MSESADRESQSGGGVNELVEVVKTVVYALLIALFLRVLFFQPFTIPSASMEPNLYEGDYIIVSKFSYGYSRHSIPFSPHLFSGRILEQKARRGYIVVFKLPSDGRTDYIKRVVGIAGDKIQVREGLLYVNDKLIQRVPMSPAKSINEYGQVNEVARFEERLDSGKVYDTQDFGTDQPLDNTKVFEVPEGNYFMMGDNRDNSLDSRVSPLDRGVGMVPAENLVGKAQIVLLSWKPQASIFLPWTWVLDARPSRFFKLLK